VRTEISQQSTVYQYQEPQNTYWGVQGLPLPFSCRQTRQDSYGSTTKYNEIATHFPPSTCGVDVAVTDTVADAAVFDAAVFDAVAVNHDRRQKRIR
jgi:hypothetical protein